MVAWVVEVCSLRDGRVEGGRMERFVCDWIKCLGLGLSNGEMDGDEEGSSVVFVAVREM